MFHSSFGYVKYFHLCYLILPKLDVFSPFQPTPPLVDRVTWVVTVRYCISTMIDMFNLENEVKEAKDD